MTVSIKNSILPGGKIVLQRTNAPPLLHLLSEQTRTTYINTVEKECLRRAFMSLFSAKKVIIFNLIHQNFNYLKKKKKQVKELHTLWTNVQKDQEILAQKS